MKNMLTNAVDIARRLCEEKLSLRDVAVDCTMGNGYDTEHLCRLVGEEGRVYAFDIQQAAVEITRNRLAERKLLDRARLIHDGHQHIDGHVREKVRLVMFNLGYLPKGNHDITTKSDTTMEAVTKCLGLLESGGMLMIVAYPGHDNGRKERDALVEFASSLDQKEFHVARLCFMNQVNDPPELFCIEKTYGKPMSV